MVVVMDRYEMEKALEAVEKYRVTHVCCATSSDSSGEAERGGEEVVRKYDCSSLREIVRGVALLGKDIIEECAKNFPQAVTIQVTPTELEDLLLTPPEISDAAVVQLSDAEAGEIPVTFVVRASNSSISESVKNASSACDVLQVGPSQPPCALGR
ncbi:hypothetical protein ACH5RR_005497 [Cinchona calisaya]|uniref:4-coumarate--CoA ligase n=1 Tax=Cinchona calisaya TaxID=153742 RepID=A0ABD3ALC2_9GENT